MEMNVLKKVLVAVIIMLFVGASIMPSLSGNTARRNDGAVHIKPDFFSSDFKMENYRDSSIEVFYPTDDTFIDHTQPNIPLGSQVNLIVRPESSLELTTLVRFDLSSIPSGSVVVSANLNLYYWHWNDMNPAGRSLAFHHITEEWDEDTVTYNARPSWNPSIISSATVPSSTGMWMECDLTSEIQDVINGASNYGWQIMDHGSGNPMIYFRSKEYADSGYHPYLEIEYEVEQDPIAANWLGNTNIVSNPSSSEEPVIQNDSVGDVHVAWQDDRDGNYEIYYKKLDKDGNELIPDIRLTDDPASSSLPGVGIDDGDNVHIVFQDQRSGNWQVYYTKLDNVGNTLIGDTRITESEDSCINPSISVSDLNNIHVTWQDNRHQNWEIYYIKLDNDGSFLSDEIRLTNNPDDSMYPDISTYHDRIAHVSWQDLNEGNYAIYYNDVFNDLLAVSLSYFTTDSTKPYLAQVGVPLNFSIELQNIGDISLDDVAVEIVVGETSIWSTDLDIDAGSATTQTIPWTSSQQGWFDVLLRIDSENEFDEFIETNNEIGIRIPIVDNSNIYTTLFPGDYFDALMACERIEIDAGSILNFFNCDIIMYGSSEILNHGLLNIQDSLLTTSHASEYISQFVNYPDSFGLQITNSEISQLGGFGIELQSLAVPPLISGNIITDSQNYAITCNGGQYNFDNNVIMRSGQYDFNIINSQVIVSDSYFDQEKINLDTPDSSLTYNRQIQCTVRDENNTLVEGAEVIIKDVNNDTIWTGSTNENGQIDPVLVTVLEMTGAKDMVVHHAPFHFEAAGPQGFAGSDAPENPLFGPLPPGNWEIKLYGATITKYAILYAGWDSTSQDSDRYAYWNEIEFTYRVLTQYKGYKAENIRVLFMNGKDGTAYGGQTNAIINYPANVSNFEKSIQYIGSKIKNDILHSDTLFIFTSDHGLDRIGSSLATNDGPLLNRSHFGKLLNIYIGDNASQIFMVMGQCYSGGFIPAVRGHRRVIMTAAYYNEFSWWYHNTTMDEHPFDGLSFFTNEFTASNYNKIPGVGSYVDTIIANNQKGYKNTTDWFQHYPFSSPYHDTTVGLLNLDDNSDGTITIHEAFDYAHDNDLVGRVDGKFSNSEISQEVDDDFIVMSSSAGKVLLYRYDGNGKFSGQTINVGGTLEKVFVRYIDSFNEDDIVVIDSASDKVKVLLNRGDFTFSITNYTTGVNPQGLWVGDLNGDGYHDIVTANKGDDDISVRLNTGFGTYPTRADYDVGDGPHEVVAAQLDYSNNNDLVVLNENAKTFTVLFNNGGGGFVTKTHYSCYGSGTPSSVAITDVNGDDYNDIIITLIDKNKAEIWTNNGLGSFTSRGTVDTKTSPEFIYATDLDYDGLKDIVIAHGSSAFIIYENCGNGTLNYTDVNYNFPNLGKAIGGIFATDLDGDEDPDFIVPVTGDVLSTFLNEDTDKQGKMEVKRYDGYLTAGLQITSIHGTNHNKPRYWRL